VGRLSNRAAARLAWTLLAFSAVCAVLKIALSFLNRGGALPIPWTQTAIEVGLSLAVLAFPVVGAVVAARRPRHPIVWLFLAFGVVEGIGGFAALYAVHALLVRPGLPAVDAAAWLANMSIVADFGMWMLLYLLFPHGRLPSSRWRILASLSLLGAGVLALGQALAPGPLHLAQLPIDNPLGIESGIVATLVKPFAWHEFTILIGLYLVSVASLVARLLRARGDERQQIKWLVCPAALHAGSWVAVVLIVEVSPKGTSLSWPLAAAAVTLAAMALGAGVGIVKHRLFDIDAIVRKSVVYAVLWLLIAAAYVGVAALLGLTASQRLPVEAAIALTILATVVFQPARRRLETLADRWVFGERLSRYELLTRFGAELERTLDPQELLPRLAETARRGLDARWARVLLHSEAHADAGIADGEPVLSAQLRLPGEPEPAGRIECGPKREGEYTDEDRSLLESLARQAGLAIKNAGLASELAARLEEIRRQAEQLAASRARIVSAQDAERRRIERNIHDGAQQALVALIAKLGLARSQLRREPAQVESALADLQEETQMVLEDLRDLAQGIHPSVLNDRGLLEAVEARARAIPLPVRIDVDGRLRGVRFADEVEGAAYFLVSEALANALKHAGALRAEVRIRHDNGHLLVEVSDDGTGFEPAQVPQRGLANLADRLEALGGRLRVSSRPGEGATVSGRVPAQVREEAYV
jgi:signal transduction histidine kinase